MYRDVFAKVEFKSLPTAAIAGSEFEQGRKREAVVRRGQCSLRGSPSSPGENFAQGQWP